uniref:non-specific serine/threonine protein kinase n=1 Tax=Fagus sylvatica TaxID=28930 RepID=A0A2N9G6U5_FAGSY
MRGGARTIPMRLADRNPYQGFTRKISLVRGEGLVREFEHEKVKFFVVTPSNETDHLALLKFKETIDNDLYGIFSSWNDSIQFCNWYGITCGRRHQRVTTLKLQGHKLHGTITPYIGNLTFLRKINLQNNSFYGEIPKEVSYLFRLQHLNLSNNTLGGEIPASLSNCSELGVMVIFINKLIGKIPLELGSLTMLHVLGIGQNNLTGGIPPSLGNLSSLTFLSVVGNNLEGNIPKSIGHLKSLEGLSAGGNKLTGMIPSSLYNISSIKALSFAINQLSGTIPTNIGLTLPNLKLFLIADNEFFGPIPGSLCNASRLQKLDLGNNYFVGSVPTNLGNLLDLEWLSLGALPNSIGNLTTQLTGLYFGANQLSGTIPAALENLINLIGLGMEDNLFTGQIPNSLGNLTQLVELFLVQNNLEGSIPPSIGNCQSLQQLDVSQNYLGGVIPGQEEKIQKETIFNSLKDGSPSNYFIQNASSSGFSLNNLIGSGSFGSVYKGVLDQEERLVAVKVLNLEKKGAPKSFVAECNVLRNVRHRNLIKILTCCSSINYNGDEFKALVFEFMTNGNLDMWLHPMTDSGNQSKQLSVLQRLIIAIDVASALNYLHNHCEQQIIHCDLKPSNILLDNEMIAHVSDFCLARFLSTTHDSSQKCTSTIGLMGSIGYACPEYGMGGDASIEGGILVLEMFTRRRPTDDIFKDGLNLHNFVKMALLERLVQVVNPMLLPREAEKWKQLL